MNIAIIYLFSLGLDYRFFINLIASRVCRPKSLCTAGKSLYAAIWRNHNPIFKKQIGVSVIIYIYGPRENKSIIRFVTDCPRLYVGLLNLIDGSASPRRP